MPGGRGPIGVKIRSPKPIPPEIGVHASGRPWLPTTPYLGEFATTGQFYESATRPCGLWDPGVFYQDRSGCWTEGLFAPGTGRRGVEGGSFVWRRLGKDHKIVPPGA